MPLSAQHTSDADFYFGVLSNLNPESKLDLISKLSQSLKQDYGKEKSGLMALFGSYKGSETAEEIIESIRASRTSNRQIEPL